MIDMIAKEAIIKNVAKLKKAKVKTMPYASTLVNTISGEIRGHAGMIFHYKNDTWHYDPSSGSRRIYRDKHSKDYLEIVNRAYSDQPQIWVKCVFPLVIADFFRDEGKSCPAKFFNNIDLASK